MFCLTPADAAYLNELSEDLGFKSRSQLVTAVIERLVGGGFSGATFVKLGWQFANAMEKLPDSTFDLFSAVRPLPPLIGDEDEPKPLELLPFLEGLKKQARKEQAA